MSKAKDKGTKFETLIKDYFLSQNFDCERQAQSGKNDIGDLKIWLVDAVFELKNYAQLHLPEWIRETERERQQAKRKYGFTIFKKRGTQKPEEQYVLMTVGQLSQLLKELYPAAVKEDDGEDLF